MPVECTDFGRSTADVAATAGASAPLAIAPETGIVRSFSRSGIGTRTGRIASAEHTWRSDARNSSASIGRCAGSRRVACSTSSSSAAGMVGVTVLGAGTSSLTCR